MTFDLDIYRAILLAFVFACFGLLVYRQFFMAPPPQFAPGERLTDRAVLLVIAVGLIAILLSVVWGLFLNGQEPGSKELPNWAENVLVAISTAAALKLGDCLSALVALAGGRQVQRLGEKLGESVPAGADGGTTTETMQVDAEKVTVKGGRK